MKRKSLSQIFGRKNIQKAQKYLNVAADVADTIISLRDKPKATDYISVGLKLIQSISDGMSSNVWNFFNEGWDDLETWGFSENLINIVSENFHVEEITGTENYFIYGCNVDGEEVAWSVESDFKHGPFIKTDRHNETLAVIGRTLWERHGSAIELVGVGYQGSKTEIVSQDCHLRADLSRSENVLGSQKANDILSRIKFFNDKGYNRSIILVGPPGTGKTSIMKFIAKELNMFSLRINAGEMSHIQPRDIVRAVELLQPNLLIIDDFDRFDGTSSMLSELEAVNKSVQVFMVTCNSTCKLDSAVLRPGRFDEIIEIINIDPNIIEKLLGDVPDELKEIMKNWPVAFIEEYKKRRDVLGDKEAFEEIEQFKERISDLLNDHMKMNKQQI